MCTYLSDQYCVRNALCACTCQCKRREIQLTSESPKTGVGDEQLGGNASETVRWKPSKTQAQKSARWQCHWMCKSVQARSHISGHSPMVSDDNHRQRPFFFRRKVTFKDYYLSWRACLVFKTNRSKAWIYKGTVSQTKQRKICTKKLYATKTSICSQKPKRNKNQYLRKSKHANLHFLLHLPLNMLFKNVFVVF